MYLKARPFIALSALMLIVLCQLSVAGENGLTVSITYPKVDEIVAGTIDVKGGSTGASRVEIKIDAEDHWSLVTGIDAWSFTLDTTGLTDGEHIIFARASNSTDTSDVESLRFHVNNTPPEFISMDTSATPLEIGPGENVTVSGLLEYDNGVKVIGATVTIRILGLGNETSVGTDENGYFLKRIVGPSDAGRYTIQVTASDGILEESREYSLTVSTPYQPDLTVSMIELNPPNPDTDDTVEVFATIKNLGDQGASGKARFYIDGSLLDSKTVTVDKSEIVKTVWIARAGTHTLKVEVTDVTPTDRDLANNAMTMDVTPRSVPEVEVVTVAPSNPTPREGLQVSVLIRLENKGHAGTTGTMTLYDGPPSGGQQIGRKTFQINANETLDVYIIWGPVKGEHTLHAKVEVLNQEPTDKLEMTKAVSVLPPLKKKETPGPGAGLVLLTLTWVAIALWKVRTRPL